MRTRDVEYIFRPPRRPSCPFAMPITLKVKRLKVMAIMSKRTEGGLLTGNPVDFADEDSDEDDARSKRYRSTAGMLFNAAALPLSVIRPHVSRRSRYCSLSAMWRFVRFIPRSFQAWLASEKMYARRERLHNLLASARSSRHVQYATKCGLGLVLLSLPGWLPFDSPGEPGVATSAVTN